MQIQNIKYEPSFGVYLKTQYTQYGHRDIGKYKDYNIDIYHDNETKSKLIYISNKFLKWIKYKLIYFNNNKRRTVGAQNVNL